MDQLRSALEAAEINEIDRKQWKSMDIVGFFEATALPTSSSASRAAWSSLEPKVASLCRGRELEALCMLQEIYGLLKGLPSTPWLQSASSSKRSSETWRARCRALGGKAPDPPELQRIRLGSGRPALLVEGLLGVRPAACGPSCCPSRTP